MLSPKVREHGRETRGSIAPEGDPNAFARQCTTRDSRKSISESHLVKQMAKTFRSTRHFRSFQSFTTAICDADHLFVEDEATHCSNAATLGETESWLDRRPSDPARVAQSEWRQIAPFALHDQARVEPAGHDSQIQPAETGVFSETLAGAVWQSACAGLDVPVSRRQSQDLRLSHLAFAHARLHTN